MSPPGSAAPEEPLPAEFEAIRRSPIARSVMRAGRRMRETDRRRPFALDSLLALAMLAVGLIDLFSFFPHDTASRQYAVHGVTGWLVVTVLGQSLALVGRRRAPHAVLGVVLACSVAQWALGTSLRSVGSLMIAIYTLARYGRLKWLPWSAPFVVAALTVAAYRVYPFRQQSLVSLFLLCCAVAAPAAVGLVVRVRRAQLTALADRAARLEVEREQRVQLATLAERSRVSREMHDIVGHNLAVIVGLADGAAAAAVRDPARGTEVLPVIAGTARQALSELRRTLGSLSAGSPGGAELNPQPGIAELATLLERIQAAGPGIEYRTAGDLDALPAGLQLAVYRIVQEALTNSLKHAGPATKVQVALRADERQVEVRVQDIGNPEGARTSGGDEHEGQGLLGIRERAALAGGTARAGPADHGGWLVRAVLPLTPRPLTEDDPR